MVRNVTSAILETCLFRQLVLRWNHLMASQPSPPKGNQWLIRPYFWGGYLRGGRLTSHDHRNVFPLLNLNVFTSSEKTQGVFWNHAQDAFLFVFFFKKHIDIGSKDLQSWKPNMIHFKIVGFLRGRVFSVQGEGVCSWGTLRIPFGKIGVHLREDI